MTVGIITFHRAINYGAVLQAFALHTTLNKLNVDNCVIDYKCSKIDKEYQLLTDYKYYPSYKGKLVHTFHLPVIISKRYKFRQFIRKNIKLSRKKDINREDLLNGHIDNEITKFITGSDQVWHYEVTGFDTTYFLDFVKDPQQKKSYAASFGFEEIPDIFLNRYKELLKNFSDISVREASGAKIIKKILDRDAYVVLDPVLLLSKGQWSDLIRSRVKLSKYILVFCIVTTNTIMMFTNELKAKTGLPVIYIEDTYSDCFTVFNTIGLGPVEFLDLLLNATYIITNSFHGTAFSILFNKHFFVELQNYSNNTNTRITHLLSVFNLEERVITNDFRTKWKELIDYVTVNRILVEKQVQSIDYLKNVFCK